MEAAFIVLFVILLVGGYLWNQKTENARKLVWDAQANQLSLSFNGEGRIEGQVNGDEITIELLTRGSGKSQYYVTSFETLLGGAPALIKISREHLGTKLLKGVGFTTEHQVHDPEFDRKFLIQGMMAGEIQEWLTSERKAAIVDLSETYAEFEMGSKRLQIAVKSTLAKPGEIESTLNHFLALAGPLQNAEAPASPAEPPRTEVPLVVEDVVSPIDLSSIKGTPSVDDSDDDVLW